MHILDNLVAYRYPFLVSLAAEYGADSGYEDSGLVGDSTEGDFSVVDHKSNVKGSDFYFKSKRIISCQWTIGEVLRIMALLAYHRADQRQCSNVSQCLL